MRRIPSPNEKRETFRRLIASKELLVMPGGFSPLYARVAEEAGFESFFIAGSQLSAFLYGVPDSGIIGLRDVVDHARHVAAHSSIPIFVDADTGYGNAVNVHFAVQEFVRSGVAGMQIEDQEAPKKSGTGGGRRCITTAEAVGKYRAAVAARDAIDPSFVVCARCDFIGAEGGTFEGAIERCIAYAEEGGVDLVWLNSPGSRDEIRAACERIPVPVLTLWGGEAPAPTLEEYEQLGVAVALYPTIAATSGLQASWQLLKDFRGRGTTALDEWAVRTRNSPQGVASQGALIGTDAIRELEDQFIPVEAQRDYSSTFGHAPIV